MPGASICKAAVLSYLLFAVKLVQAAPAASVEPCYHTTTTTKTVTRTTSTPTAASTATSFKPKPKAVEAKVPQIKVLKEEAKTKPPKPALKSSVNLAIKANFPDPAIYNDNGTWYAFGTNNGKQNVQVATTKVFNSTWSILKDHDALPKPGAWANQKRPAVWAPDVIRNDAGKYVMYYSAEAAKGSGILGLGAKKHCVGAATSESVKGPYEPAGDPMFCDKKAGGAIDAAGFLDVDGKRYVTYKVDANSNSPGGSCGKAEHTPLMLQPVAGDGMTFTGPATQILDREARDGPLIEAPSLTRTKDGKYVLFFSSNCFNTPLYDIAYAVADKVTGPYVKAGPLAVTGTEGLRAPGGASVAADGEHMLFHADEEGSEKRKWKPRLMFSARVKIDAKTGRVTW